MVGSAAVTAPIPVRVASVKTGAPSLGVQVLAHNIHSILAAGARSLQRALNSRCGGPRSPKAESFAKLQWRMGQSWEQYRLVSRGRAAPGCPRDCRTNRHDGTPIRHIRRDAYEKKRSNSGRSIMNSGVFQIRFRLRGASPDLRRQHCQAWFKWRCNEMNNIAILTDKDG